MAFGTKKSKQTKNTEVKNQQKVSAEDINKLKEQIAKKIPDISNETYE